MLYPRHFEIAVPATLFITSAILIGVRFSKPKTHEVSTPITAVPQIKTASKRNIVPRKSEVPLAVEAPQLMQWDGDVQDPPSDAIIFAEMDALQKLAASGNAEAQFRLAVLMLIRVDQGSDEFTIDETVKWFRAAAEQKHLEACYQLAVLYTVGIYVPQDSGLASELYQLATPSKDGYAELQIGVISADAKDYAQARHWFSKAAKQGSSDAAYNLGYFAFEGLGEPVDYKKARQHFLQAAEQDHVTACAYLGEISLEGHGRPQNQSEAMAWYMKAAELGNAIAQFNVALLHEQNGDDFTALKWYEKAGRQGYANAASNAGVLYFNLGDYANAEKWMRHAITLGSTEAIFNISNLERQKKLEESVYYPHFGY